MVIKTIKLPEALDARLRRLAKAKKQSYSALTREAIVRGLDAETGIDMQNALSDFTTAGEGPGNLSTNKNYFREIGRKRDR